MNWKRCIYLGSVERMDKMKKRIHFDFSLNGARDPLYGNNKLTATLSFDSYHHATIFQRKSRG